MELHHPPEKGAIGLEKIPHSGFTLNPPHQFTTKGNRLVFASPWKARRRDKIARFTISSGHQMLFSVCWTRSVRRSRIDTKSKHNRAVGYHRQLKCRTYPSTLDVSGQVVKQPRTIQELQTWFRSSRKLQHITPDLRPKFMTSLEQPPTTLHSFHKLPPEIKDRVWSYCRPEPQILQISKKTRFGDAILHHGSKENMFVRHHYHRDWEPPFCAISPVPSLVQACHSSRTYAFKHWYTMIYTPDPQLSHECRKLSFSFDITQNYLYLGCRICRWTNCWQCFFRFDEEFLQSVRRLVLRLKKDSSPWGALWGGLGEWQELKEVILLEHSHTVLPPGATLSDLIEKKQVFYWQEDMSLKQWAHQKIREANDLNLKWYKERVAEYDAAVEAKHPDGKVKSGSERNELGYLHEPYPPTRLPLIDAIWVAKLQTWNRCQVNSESGRGWVSRNWRVYLINQTRVEWRGSRMTRAIYIRPCICHLLWSELIARGWYQHCPNIVFLVWRKSI